MKYLYLILGLGVLCSACQDDDVVVKENVCMENYSGPLDILWSVPLRSDTTIGNSIHPVIYPELVLYSILKFDGPNTIYSFDPDSGEKQWEFEDFPNVGEPIDFNNLTQGYADKFYFNVGNYKVLININTPSTDWESLQSFSDEGLSVGAEHLYYVQFYDENNNNLIVSSEIFRVNKNKVPGWESVYLQSGSTANRIGFDTPAEWISPMNDTLLIFASNIIGVPVVSNLVAYNISQNKIQWEIPNITDIGETSRFIPMIQNNLAYITNARTISCVDLVNGVELWETEDLGTGFSQCAAVIGDDKIFVNGSDGKVRGINLSDGSVAWKKDDSNNNPPNMAYYEGAIYYCTNSALGNYLYGLEAATGEVFYQEESPNKDCRSSADFSWGVSIDEATGRLYTLDGYFAMCIQLEPR